ncbi:MAG: hypothetical protein ACQEQO_03170 [Thermodesulfobacteriota bacterium]
MLSFEKPGDFQNSTWFTINHRAIRYTKQGLPLRRNYVCPAFNPIREGRYRDSFYDQRSYQLPLKMATPLSFELSAFSLKLLCAFSLACPVKQPAGLPDEDRGFTGELLCFQLPVADRLPLWFKKGNTSTKSTMSLRSRFIGARSFPPLTRCEKTAPFSPSGRLCEPEATSHFRKFYPLYSE